MKVLGLGRQKLGVLGTMVFLFGLGCQQDYTITQTTKSTSVVPPGGGPITQIDAFNVAVPGQTKIDMLFVVDNSGSMADNQQALADGFNAFITQFVNKSVDWRIGLITTDSKSYNSVPITNGPGSNPRNPFYGYYNPFPDSSSTPGNLLMRTQFPSSPRYMTSGPSKQQVIDEFKANVKVGTAGNGDERIIYNALQALDPYKLQGENAGFRRADAFMSIIGVSDENEDIRNDPVMVNGVFDHTETTPEQRIDRFLGSMPALCDASCPGWRVDLIVDLDAPYHQTNYPMVAYDNGTNPYPDFYLKFASKTGSKLANINATDWGPNLSNIASGIIQQAQSQFKLSYAPISGTLQVSLDGTAVPLSASNGYSFDAGTLTVQLNGSYASSAPGKTLRIQYQRN